MQSARDECGDLVAGMKRYSLKPRRCPCGGWIKPHNEFEKPDKFNRRKYCSNTCPKAHEWKRTGRYSDICKAARERKAREVERTPETNTDPINLYLMGKL